MTNTYGDLEDKLAQLRGMYLDHLPAKATEISEVAPPPEGASGDSVRTYLENLEALSHKLAGSGATYGFPEISEAAKALELSCSSFLKDDPDDHERAVSETCGLESNLQDVIADVARESKTMPRPSGGGEETEVAASEPNRTVAMIGAERDILERIGDELADFDFNALFLDVDDGVVDALIKADPLGIVLDMDMGGAEDAVLEAIGKLHGDGKLLCPLIALSNNNGIQTRLKAARAHSEHFLPHPVMTSDIVDVLDQMAVSDGGDDFRILIVDDDASTARYTQTVLQGAGMIAEHITEPMKIMEMLDDFLPELILMDLYMPDCNGQELAAVIRQQEAFSGVPIVFLSGESDVDKQLVAMHSGGDDFLTKPIKPKHLIGSVRMRVRRFRMLRSQMVRDSMTGLLNHTTTHEFLNKEVARSHRGMTPLAVAALDIDHFKSVNDTHGHAVGDIVIKSLARLLKQRLRGTDIIGRMGGEEFAAVLPETTAKQAVGIFGQIRQDFADIEFKSDAGDFSVTLSCGIAEYPAYQTSAELLEASDAALYKAKHGGRNKVVLEHVQTIRSH